MHDCLLEHPTARYPCGKAAGGTMFREREGLPILIPDRVSSQYLEGTLTLTLELGCEGRYMIGRTIF